MTRYLDFRAHPVTSPFGIPRPKGPHQGQDHAPPRGTPLLACEAGALQLAIVRQHGDGFSPDLAWPDGSWWPYSRYYEWWAGGLAILYGSQYTHVWLHIDLAYIYKRAETAMATLVHRKVRDPKDYSRYLIAEVLWHPLVLAEGDLVAITGVSGYDTAPHVHYQLMAPGRNAHKVLDPRTLWG